MDDRNQQEGLFNPLLQILMLRSVLCRQFGREARTWTGVHESLASPDLFTRVRACIAPKRTHMGTENPRNQQ